MSVLKSHPYMRYCIYQQQGSYEDHVSISSDPNTMSAAVAMLQPAAWTTSDNDSVGSSVCTLDLALEFCSIMATSAPGRRVREILQYRCAFANAYGRFLLFPVPKWWCGKWGICLCYLENRHCSLSYSVSFLGPKSCKCLAAIGIASCYEPASAFKSATRRCHAS